MKPLFTEETSKPTEKRKTRVFFLFIDICEEMATRRSTHLLRLLGLPAEADLPAIKARYRELAKQHHPDLAGPSSNTEEFSTITEAYQKLLEGGGAAVASESEHHPAMSARWSRMSGTVSEYPAWFNPDAAEAPNAEATGVVEDRAGEGSGGSGRSET
jgi:hypothetical protein